MNEESFLMSAMGETMAAHFRLVNMNFVHEHLMVTEKCVFFSMFIILLWIPNGLEGISMIPRRSR